MTKGILHKSLLSGRRVTIGEGDHQIEIILKEVKGKRASLTIVADKRIKISFPEPVEEA